MSRHSKKEQRVGSGFVEVKSKFDAEFRRFSVWRGSTLSYEELHGLLERLHGLKETPFLVSYSDPRDGDLLPINNDDNLSRALVNARPLLRVIVQRRGESLEELNGYGSATPRPRNIISTILRAPGTRPKTLAISNPHDFRQVSSIIDVDVVPETCRRVRLVKHGSERPLGFYIRDGTSFRVTPDGMQKVPGIFISRLVPGGLAESTGLLAVNDEVLEVNGIEVAGKTLDQVTDMMVANSWNLIITVKPANQRGTAPGTLRSTTGGGGTETLQSGGGAVRRGSVSRGSQASITSEATTCSEETELDQDDILDHVPPAATTASATPPVLHL